MKNLFKAFDPDWGLSDSFEFGEYPQWGASTREYWASRCQIYQWTGETRKGEKVFEALEGVEEDV